MAKNFNQSEYANLQKQATKLEKALDLSSTAYSSTKDSTRSDLSDDLELKKLRMKIDRMRGKKIREEWYGKQKDPNVDVKKEKPGWFMKGIETLQKPLKAIVGAEKWALGRSKKGLFESMDVNMKSEGVSHGGLLREIGAPRFVSMPLGFMLDIALDPFTWATAGSSSLIGGVAKGAIKGTQLGGIAKGAEAAGASVLSNIGRKTAKTLPFLAPVKTTKKIGEKLIEKAGEEGVSKLGNRLVNIAEKYKGVTTRVGEKSIKNLKKYQELVGEDVYDKLGKGFFGLSDLNKGKTIGSFVERKISDIPSYNILGKTLPKGEDIVEFFKYSPKGHIGILKARDLATRAAEKKRIILTTTGAGKNVFKTVDEAVDSMNKIVRSADEAIKPVRVFNTFDNAKRLLDMSKTDYNLKDLIKAYKITPRGKTGVKWYDDIIDNFKATTIDDIAEKARIKNMAENFTTFKNVKDWKPFEKTLNAYSTFIDVFKWAKIAMSPTYYVNSAIGNGVMGKMI